MKIPFKKLVVANWKMNPDTVKQSIQLLQKITKQLPKKHKAKIVICPPTAYIYALANDKTKKGFVFGAQDVSVYESGSHTGEIGMNMLSSLGVSYCIIGHTERRQPKIGAQETDDVVAKKVFNVLQAKKVPIVCVGELTRDPHGLYLGLLKKQILSSFAGIPKNLLSEIVIAYEPVFAIGGSKSLDSHEIHEMALFIRKVIVDAFSDSVGRNIKILYGGAVDETTSKSIIEQGNVDGLLLGRASLDPLKFAAIISKI